MSTQTQSTMLTLEVGEQRHEFKSPAALEFALAGRAALPSAKITKMVSQPDEALLKEAAAIHAVEKRFANALSGSLEDVTSIGPFLSGLDPSLISQDHDWRAIVRALNATGATHEEFKKVALVKYMQYLTSRQEVIRSLFSVRQASRKEGALDADQANAWDDDGNLKETVIIDLTAFAVHNDDKPVEFTRLPKGETVDVPLAPDRSITVLLAKHRCSIVYHDGPVFIDDAGHDSTLRRGKNLVGRDAGNDVVINSNFRDVSRKHLIIETDDNLVRLTDISSHGTSIPPGYLDITSV